jgi:putative methyltransferase (TIGR04325 family)
MPSARRALRLLTPPVVWWLADRLRGGQAPFDGPFPTWDTASQAATGWDSPAIVEQAVSAALQVIEGKAAFERDSRPYDRIIYSPTILAALLLAIERYRRLNVIDFGGALGSNYYQNIKLLRAAPRTPVAWNVIERPALAKIGRDRFQTAELRFHDDLADLEIEDAALLFTGSLQYVADAFGLLEQVVASLDIVALDNVLVWPQAEHAVFVQHLDRTRFGQVSLPTWCFAKDRLAEWFTSHGFTLVELFRPRPRPRFENCGMLFARL